MYDYQLSGFDGVGKYLTDYGTLATAGLTGNLAYTFLGSHQVRMTPVRENADGSVTWRYTAYNESDIESATHPGHRVHRLVERHRGRVRRQGRR